MAARKIYITAVIEDDSEPGVGESPLFASVQPIQITPGEDVDVVIDAVTTSGAPFILTNGVVTMTVRDAEGVLLFAPPVAIATTSKAIAAVSGGYTALLDPQRATYDIEITDAGGNNTNAVPTSELKLRKPTTKVAEVINAPAITGTAATIGAVSSSIAQLAVPLGGVLDIVARVLVTRTDVAGEAIIDLTSSYSNPSGAAVNIIADDSALQYSSGSAMAGVAVATAIVGANVQIVVTGVAGATLKWRVAGTGAVVAP